MLSYDQDSHVAPHFDCLDATNTVMQLTMCLVSYVTDTGANESYMIKHVTLHLILIILTSKMQSVDDVVSLT